MAWEYGQARGPRTNSSGAHECMRMRMRHGAARNAEATREVWREAGRRERWRERCRKGASSGRMSWVSVALITRHPHGGEGGECRRTTSSFARCHGRRERGALRRPGEASLHTRACSTRAQVCGSGRWCWRCWWQWWRSRQGTEGGGLGHLLSVWVRVERGRRAGLGRERGRATNLAPRTALVSKQGIGRS